MRSLWSGKLMRVVLNFIHSLISLTILRENNGNWSNNDHILCLLRNIILLWSNWICNDWTTSFYTILYSFLAGQTYRNRYNEPIKPWSANTLEVHYSEHILCREKWNESYTTKYRHEKTVLTPSFCIDSLYCLAIVDSKFSFFQVFRAFCRGSKQGCNNLHRRVGLRVE